MMSNRMTATVNAVTALLDDNEKSVFEKISCEIEKQIQEDDENSEKKGRQILKDYLENPEAADNLLMALCGWRMKSLLIFARVIPDDEGLLGD